MSMRAHRFVIEKERKKEKNALACDFKMWEAIDLIKRRERYSYGNNKNLSGSRKNLVY